MLDIARKLSQGLPHVRVDLYNVEDQIYFDELTFFTRSGMIPFEPNDCDEKLGGYFKVPMDK